jgi:hypothetical protein
MWMRGRGRQIEKDQGREGARERGREGGREGGGGFSRCAAVATVAQQLLPPRYVCVTCASLPLLAHVQKVTLLVHCAVLLMKIHSYVPRCHCLAQWTRFNPCGVSPWNRYSATNAQLRSGEHRAAPASTTPSAPPSPAPGVCAAPFVTESPACLPPTIDDPSACCRGFSSQRSSVTIAVEGQGPLSIPDAISRVS